MKIVKCVELQEEELINIEDTMRIINTIADSFGRWTPEEIFTLLYDHWIDCGVIDKDIKF